MADNGLAPAAPPEAPGATQYRNMAAQVGQPLADQWKTEQSATMLRSGKFTGQDIDAWWGDDRPAHTAAAPTGIPQPHVASNFLEAMSAGWDMSVTGLTANLNARNLSVAMDHGDRPMVNTVLPEDQPLWMKIGAGIGQGGGDLPFSFASAVAAPKAGGATGTGAAMGGGPEALRQLLITAYNFHPTSGASPIQSFQDFASAYTDHLHQVAVATASGGLGGKAGGLVSDGVMAMGGNKIVSTLAGATTMATTATAVAGTMDQHMPDAKDFTSAAIMALGFEAAGHMQGGRVNLTEAGQRVASNLQKIYVRTGILPQDALNVSRTSPTLRQEILAQDVNGDPVAPRLAMTRPPEPPHFERPPARPDEATPAFGRRPNEQLPQEPHPPTTANTVDQAAGLLTQLEGSGDRSVSPKGAIGKFQIMPGTARQYWSRVFPGEEFDSNRLFDPKVNAALGHAIITDLFRQYHGNMDAMAIAYNAGPGRANTYMTKGAGTRLKAIPDRTARGGIRYEAEPSARDEAWLPLETQHYLANGRRRSGGEMPGEGGDAGHNGNAAWDSNAYPGSAFGRRPNTELEALQAEEATTGRGLDQGAADLSSASTWRGAEVDDLVAELNSNIGEPPKPPGFQWTVDRTADQLFELSPARRIDNDLIQQGLLDRRHEMGAEDMLRQTYSADDVAATFIKYGVVKLNADGSREVGGPSFNQAAHELRADGGDPDGFRAWLNASRALPKEQAGKTTGFNPFASAELLANKGAQAMFSRATETWTGVTDGFLDFMRDSGMYHQDQIDAMRAEGTYATWRRLKGDTPSLTGGRRPGSSPRGFYKFEGSDGKVADPIAATMDNMRVGIGMALRNQARLWFVDRALADPRFAAVVGFKTERSADPNMDVVDNALKEAGFNEDQLENARQAYGNLINQRLDADLADNEFAYYRDGQRMVARIDSPEFAQLMQRTSSPGDANILWRTLHTFAAIERAGIVAMPDYGPSVAVFHQLNQFISDPLHNLPFMAPLKGIMHVLKQDDVMQRVTANGGLGSSMAHLDRSVLDGTIDSVFEATNTWEKFWNVAKSPKDWPSAALHTAQLVMEAAAASHNVGYALIAEGKGLSTQKAMTMSRKSGLDYYERAGSDLANKIASISPMFRGKLLGMKQAVEAYEPDNLAERTPGGRVAKAAVTMAIAAAAITLPKIALYILNRQQDEDNNTPEGQRYIDLPQTIRDTHYVFPSINGSRIQLRLPAFYGLPFGTAPERMMDAIYDQHGIRDAGKLFEEFMGEYVPFPSSPLVQGPAEIATNHNFSTGLPLMPSSMMERSPELRYTENTSLTAINLAKVIGNVSFGLTRPAPVQIDRLINDFTGGLGPAALKAIEAPMRPATPDDLKNNVFVQSFVIRHPGMNSQVIQDFYDRYQDFAQAKGDFSFLKHMAAVNGQTSLDPNQLDTSEAAAAGGLAKIPHALAMQRTLVLQITHSDKMNVDEKRQAIDNVVSQSVVMAAYGQAVMDTVRDRHLTPEQRQDFIVQETEKFNARYNELQSQQPPITPGHTE